MSHRLLFCVAALALAGCVSDSSATPQPRGAESTPAPAEAAVAAAPGVVTPAGSSGCETADLSMEGSDVIAKVEGEPIRVSDLGDDAARAEADALRAYCTELDRIRGSALDRAVDQRLIEAAAREAGEDLDSWMRERIDTTVKSPTPEEVAAYYAQHKSAEAPPLDQVEEQVAASMMRERSQEAFATILAELRTKSKVDVMLPDVRPAALAVDVPEHTATFGPAEAAVEIVEFSDFECPYCARAADAVRSVKERYGDRVRFAYRHFPLSFHPNAMKAAQYAQCAQEQDKFWPLHDAVFGAEGNLAGDVLERTAEQVGLDTDALQACLRSPRPDAQIREDMAQAQKIGVEGTPTFYINGRLFTGRPSPEGFAQAIDAELSRKG